MPSCLKAGEWSRKNNCTDRKRVKNYRFTTPDLRVEEWIGEAAKQARTYACPYMSIKEVLDEETYLMY